MKTRRIQAADIQAALREVRRTLGTEAVILGTRELSEGIEIIAAAGLAGYATSSSGATPKFSPAVARTQTQPAPAQPTQPKPAPQPAQSKPSQAQPAQAQPAQPQITQPQAARVQATAARPAPARHNGDRSRRPTRNSKLRSGHHSPQARATLGRLDMLTINQDLVALGLSPDVRKSLMSQLEPGTGAPWINAPGLLADSLPAQGPRLLSDGGRIAILGSTGVGKTTTIAKLAAHYARLHGAGQVALVNTDCYRIGAAEQLRRYGRLMGVAVHQLQDPKDLGVLLKRLDNKRLVLIDTVGNSHQDPVLTRHLLAPGPGLKPVQCFLALSFNTQMAALEKTVRNFSRLALRSTVLTKEDEAVNMGPALSIVLRHKLPVAFVTTGVQVPADIRIRSAEQLVKNAFALADQNQRPGLNKTSQSPRMEAR